MNWISVKERKPNTDLCCLVCNNRWNSHPFKAIYDKVYDVFRLDYSEMREQPCLDVTHWVEITFVPLER